MKKNLSAVLEKNGACFAVRNDKYFCTNHQCCRPLDGHKRAYHIHPDATYPHQVNIERFESQTALLEWCKERQTSEQQERCETFAKSIAENMQAVNLVTLVGATVALFSEPHKECEP